jgi:hypothetical protein
MVEMKKISEVTVLINAVYFFLSDVVVFKEDGWFHLIVLRRGAVLLDKQYKTVRGARGAFNKLFKSFFFTRAPEFKRTPEWTPFFAPEVKFINRISKACHNIL